MASDWYLGACQVNLAENGNFVMDNFRFWDIPLYQENILPNYQKCLVGNEAGLFVLYDFDEGTGNTVNDLAPYGGLTNGTTTSPEWVTGLSCIPPSYNLTYAGNGNTGGSAPSDILSPYIEDEVVTIIGPGTLAKTGYAFTAWNTLANGSGTAYSIGDTFSMPAHAVQLYAQWQLEHYSVTYSGNGNTAGSVLSDTNSYTYGSAVIALGQGTLDRDCKIFNGWNTAANGSGDTYDAGSTFNMPPNNITLYAKWQGAYESGQIVGTAGFSNARSGTNCIAFLNETPYVLFGEGAVNGKASVMKYNGNNWGVRGIPSIFCRSGRRFLYGISGFNSLYFIQGLWIWKQGLCNEIRWHELGVHWKSGIFSSNSKLFITCGDQWDSLYGIQGLWQLTIWIGYEI
ncbi:MAG: InlB B-repeat-containing protein [Chitinophagaceae bacterium]|nr:InlB B-repeat-containing protein [Chitinophagaceae bacterium]